jgi:hypothetical protein
MQRYCKKMKYKQFCDEKFACMAKKVYLCISILTGFSFVGCRLSNFKTKSNMQIPKTWLVEAILATLFCCLPFGIVGIVYAAKVSAYFESGNEAAARIASAQAKKWTLIAIGVAVLWWVLYFLFFASMFAGLAGSMH